MINIISIRHLSPPSLPPPESESRRALRVRPGVKPVNVAPFANVVASLDRKFDDDPHFQPTDEWGWKCGIFPVQHELTPRSDRSELDSGLHCAFADGDVRRRVICTSPDSGSDSDCENSERLTPPWALRRDRGEKGAARKWFVPQNSTAYSCMTKRLSALFVGVRFHGPRPRTSVCRVDGKCRSDYRRIAISSNIVGLSNY